MKKITIFILLIVMCIFTSFCDQNTSSTINNSLMSSKDVQNMNNNFTLIVDGRDISLHTSLSINYEKQYAELPLLAISEALGGEVKWVNEKKVKIVFNDTQYILNPTQKTLKKEKDSFNIINVPPGTNHGGYYQICDKEFIVDSDSLCYFVNLLGAKITIEYDTAVVTIDFDRNT